MALQLQGVEPSELPGEATDGFKLLGDEGETVMFFHWSPDDADGTCYSDVLAALPDRLDGMGYESDREAIMGEIVGRFGVGA